MPREIFDKKASSTSEKPHHTEFIPVIEDLVGITLRNPFQALPPFMVKLFARSLNPAKIPFRKPEILLPPKQLRKSLFEGIGYFALNERQCVFRHRIL
jgi:hypothetical protein